jgi:hypothetical protein
MTAQKARKHHSPIPLLLLLGSVVLLWGIYWAAVALYPFSGYGYWDPRGKFGDMFGAFNALFTACAFAGVAYGIRLAPMASRL